MAPFGTIIKGSGSSGHVSVLYSHTVAINRLGKLCLGHFDENESVRYLSTRIDGLEAIKGRLGALDLAA